MAISNETAGAQLVEDYHQLVTPEFAPLAEFAGFRAYEAVAVQETGANLGPLIDKIVADIVKYLMTRAELAPLLGESEGLNDEPRIREWLDRTITGPFDGEFGTFLREISHPPGDKATFPGVQVPLPPQLILALIAWAQGKVLEALAETCDIATISAAGGAWMNLFMLQLGIILEPHLSAPEAPLGDHQSAKFHPYAELAGFGAQ